MCLCTYICMAYMHATGMHLRSLHCAGHAAAWLSAAALWRPLRSTSDSVFFAAPSPVVKESWCDVAGAQGSVSMGEPQPPGISKHEVAGTCFCACVACRLKMCG